MDGDELFERFRRAILGGKVTFIRLVLDSLMIYVDGEPGDGRGLTFWLAADWKVTTPGGLLTDSTQAWRMGEEGPEEDDMDRVTDLIADALIDREVTEVAVDGRTRDLTVTVAGAHRIQTVSSESPDEEMWHLRENSMELTLHASSLGWTIRQFDGKSHRVLSAFPSRSGRGTIRDIREAKELYFRYDGSRFYMSRDGADAVYEQAGVPPEVEAGWLIELKRDQLARLAEPENWQVVSFFLHHSDLGHLADFVRAEPRGSLWECCCYLEMLVEYASRVREAGRDSALVSRAADRAIAEAGRLLGRTRSDDLARRVHDLIRRAEGFRREAGGD